jgi:uncharacterized protein YkwD
VSSRADIWSVRGTGRPAVRILLAVLCTTAALVASTAQAGAANVVHRESAESALVTRINEVRANNHLAALSVADPLSTAAQRHATNMAWNGYFKHDFKKDGSWYSFSTWIKWYWPGPGYTAWTAGENLAWGSPDLSARKTVTMWMNSPGHRANLLGAWNRVGVEIIHISSPGGYFKAYPDVTIVAADFGRRS